MSNHRCATILCFGIWCLCGNVELRRGVWNMLSFVRTIALNPYLRAKLFISKSDRLLPREKRLSGQKANADIIWTTGDATLSCISAVIWAHRQFLILCPDDVLDAFGYYRRHRFVIAECEPASSAVQIVAWGALNEIRQLVLSGTDNANAPHWLFRGKARGGISVRLMAAILHWRTLRDIEAIPFFLICLRRVAADFVTRADDLEVQRWALTKGFVQIPLPWRWGEFMKSVPEIECVSVGRTTYVFISAYKPRTLVPCGRTECDQRHRIAVLARHPCLAGIDRPPCSVYEQTLA